MCLRGREAGLEGISVHGEVTARTLAWNLNYLAMRHWTYHPESTLAEFAQAELAPRVGGAKAARAFIEILCQLEQGRTGPEVEKQARAHMPWWPYQAKPAGPPSVWKMWEELMEWNILKGRRIAPGVAGLA